MCGIYFSSQGHNNIERLAHRGPDHTSVRVTKAGILAHARLRIVGDSQDSSQPYVQGNASLAANGEVYNCKALAKALQLVPIDSDCDVLLPLFLNRDPSMACQSIDGVFALVHTNEEEIVVARDAIGVFPLYYCEDEQGRIVEVASERKALVNSGSKTFPPGHVYANGEMRRWYNPMYRAGTALTATALTATYDCVVLRDLLASAVKKRTMASCEFGLLLSGGLDSTLIAYLATTLCPNNKPLKSFSIGLKGSPDLEMAHKVAEWLGTDHHDFHFTVEEALGALPKVVNSVETLDPTTIRAGVPMWLLMQRIRKHTKVKMVLSGEGSDEVFAGYLYFHEAPTPELLAKECLRKLESIHRYDCQRANMTSMAHAIECRVPFLDLDVLAYAMRLPNRSPKGGVEKWALRNAFEGLVPAEFLWRQKEQFSDGVGYAWIDALKGFASPFASEQAMLASYLDGKVLESLPTDSWNPVFQSNKDASGRANALHVSHK